MAQFWAGDSSILSDSFDENGVAFNSPTLYLRARPWSADFYQDGTPSQDLWPVRHEPGHLLGFASNPSLTVSSPDDAWGARAGSLYIGRDTYRANVRVELGARLHIEDPGINGPYDAFENAGFYGVFAKLHGITTLQGTAGRDEFWGTADTGDTGSILGYGWISTGYRQVGHRFYLIKLKATGGFEVLKTRADFHPYAFGDLTNTAYGPTPMRLECVTTSPGVVDLVGYFYDNAGTYTGTGNPGWIPTTHTDTSSAYDVTGRSGFSLGQIGSNLNVTDPMICGPRAEYFQVEDIADPDNPILFHRDEFKRQQVTAGLGLAQGGTLDEPNWTSSQGAHYSILGKYRGDDHGSANNYSQLLASGADEGEAGAAKTGGLGEWVGPMISQQEFAQDRQHFSADFNFTTESSKNANLGIVLRHTDTGPTPVWNGGLGASCYLAVVIYQGATGQFAVHLRAYDGANPAVLMATSASPPISWGTEFELDFEIQNLAANARPALAAKINGTYLTFLPFGGTDGIDTSGDWIIDDRSAAVVSGTGAGPYYDSSASSPFPLATIQNWSIEPHTDIGGGGGGFEDEDTDVYASVVLTPETDGAFGVLEIPETYPSSENWTWRQVRHVLRAGPRVVRAVDRRGRRTWEIETAGMTRGERGQLEQFVKDHRGGAPFSWEEPGGSTITAAFNRAPDISLSQRLPFGEDGTVGLVELFGPDSGDVETVTAEWEPVDQAIIDVEPLTLPYYNQEVRADGIVLARASEGQGGETPDTTRDYKIVLDSAAVEFGTLTVTASGTAISGTHYSLSATSFSINPTDTEKTLTVTVLDPGRYFTRKKLILTLGGSTGGVIIGNENQLEIGFYPTPGPAIGTPPSLDFTNTGTTSSPDANNFQSFPARVDQGLSTGGGVRVSDEDTTVYVRWIASGGLTYPDDFTVNPRGLIAKGDTNTDGSSSTPPAIRIRPYDTGDPIIGQTIDLFIDHEPADDSEENFWAFVDDWRIEGSNGSFAFDNLSKVRKFAGIPTTHANGGGSNTNKDPRVGTDIVRQTQVSIATGDRVYTDLGEEAQVILQSQAIKSGWYIRESFEASEFCGGLERKQTFDGWLLFWTYVGWIEGAEASRNSHFMNLNIRNRAPGNLEMGCTFRREPPGTTLTDVGKQNNNADSILWSGGTQVTGTGVETEAGVWGLWNPERMHPDSKWGVEEETDEEGRNHTRLWCLARVDGTSKVESNDSPEITLQGTATAGSTGTTLLATGTNFNTYKVKGRSGSQENSGSRIYNRTTQTSGYVRSRESATELLCEDGISWSSGDLFYVASDNFSVSHSAGSSATDLTNTGVDFTTIGVNVGDLVFNDRDRSYGVVTLVTATTIRCGAGLSGGFNDTFENGDLCRIYINAGTTGQLTMDGGSGSTTVVDADGAFLVRGVGKLDEVYNVTRAEFAEIEEVDSDTQLTIASSPGWASGDAYEVRQRWMQPRDGWAGNAIYRYALTQGNDGRNGQANSGSIVGGTAGLRGTGAIAWGQGYVTGAAESSHLLDPGTDDRPCPIAGHPTPDTTTPKNAGPGRHWPRASFWREPRGNATKWTGGNIRWRLTIGS